MSMRIYVPRFRGATVLGIRRAWPALAWGFALLLVVPVGYTAAAPGLGARPSGVPLTVSLSGPTSVALGANATYRATASGGLPPYTWEWKLNGSPTTANISGNGTEESLSLRPLGDAIFVLTVIVNDSASVQQSQQTALVVTGASPVAVVLAVVGFAANDSADVRATVHGGSSPYVYRWTGPGAPVGWTTRSQFNTSPLAPGNTSLSVSVRDALGYVGTDDLVVHYRVATTNGGGAPWYLYIALGAVAGAVVILAFAYVRRRRSAPPSRPPAA
jgi:hypothetical protein